MGVCLFVWLSGQRPVSGNKRAPVVYYGITCGVTSLSHRPHPRSYQNSLRGDCWGKLFLFPNSVFFFICSFPKVIKRPRAKDYVNPVHVVSNSQTCFYGELQNLQTDTCSNRYWFPSCVENQNEGSSGQYIWNFLEILWPSVPPTTAQVMSATWWDVQTSWFAEFPQCTFSPCHLIFREQNKNLVSLFLPTVWLHCEILLLVSSIIYVYLLRPCCRRAGLWHMSHFVYDDGSDWGCPGKHLTWIWCRNGLSWCSYCHKHFRQVTYGQTTVVFVVLRRSRRFTTTDFHQWRMSHASITRRVLPAVEMPGCSFAHSA